MPICFDRIHGRVFFMSENNYKKISNFIWDTCNEILRDTFERREYGEIILSFTVLRRLDGVLEDKKDETIELYEKFKDKTKDPTPIILNKINKKFYNKSKYDLVKLQEDSQNYRTQSFKCFGFSELRLFPY